MHSIQITVCFDKDKNISLSLVNEIMRAIRQAFQQYLKSTRKCTIE